MTRAKDIPAFGNLQGIKVVVAAVSTAGPFAGQLYAENGAEVIWIEPVKGVDPLRWSGKGWGVENERRNVRSIMLDVVKPEGREIFLKLIAEADVFLEGSRGGQWSDWGYTDDFLWSHNKKLVIGHMSGYGQTGVKEYVKSPGYDHTISAFSGLMILNGFPDRDPILPMKFMTDYYAGLFAYGSSLAAYIRAQATGEGESFDLAQYEAGLRCQAGMFGRWFAEGFQVPRSGSRAEGAAGVGYFRCKDGNGVFTIPIGEGIMRNILPFLGLEYGNEMFPEGLTSIPRNTPGEEVFEAALNEFFSKHTAMESEEIFRREGFPLTLVMSYEQMESHPHYLARESFIEWENIKGETIKGVTAVPRFSKNPAQIWRGCPSQGMDNEDVLADLGITDQAEIDALYEKNILRKTDYVGG